MIVNYKKGMIKSYFNELEKNYNVDFADEEVFMGTGGGLCLLKGKIKAPFFFTNCDTLLDVDFGDIYEYHKSHGNLVTMICAFKHYTVPYGVVELGENGSIAAMQRKARAGLFDEHRRLRGGAARRGGNARRREDRFPRCDRTLPPGRGEGRRLSHQREQLDGHGPAGGAGEDEKKAGESAVEKRGVRRAERASP